MRADKEINALVKSAQSVTGYVDPGFTGTMHNVGASHKAKRDAEEYERFVREAEAYKKFVDDNFGGNYELAADASTGLGMVFPEIYLIGSGLAGGTAKSLGAKKAIGTGLAALKNGSKHAWNAFKPVAKAAPGKAKAGWDALRRWISGDVAGNAVKKLTGSNVAGQVAKQTWSKGSLIGGAAAGAANVFMKDPAVNHPYLKAAPWIGVATNPMSVPAYYGVEGLTRLAMEHPGWVKYIGKGIDNYYHNVENGTDIKPVFSIGKATASGAKAAVLGEVARRGMDILGGENMEGAREVAGKAKDAYELYESLPEEEKRRLWEMYGKGKEKLKSMASSHHGNESGGTNSVDNVESVAGGPSGNAMNGTNSVDDVVAKMDRR